MRRREWERERERERIRILELEPPKCILDSRHQLGPVSGRSNTPRTYIMYTHNLVNPQLYAYVNPVVCTYTECKLCTVQFAMNVFLCSVNIIPVPRYYVVLHTFLTPHCIFTVLNTTLYPTLRCTLHYTVLYTSLYYTLQCT